MESIAPDGRIGAPLDSNRQVEFNAQDHRHFDPGYAVTSVPSDLLNSRFGYVSNSRASHGHPRHRRNEQTCFQNLRRDLQDFCIESLPNASDRARNWDELNCPAKRLGRLFVSAAKIRRIWREHIARLSKL